MKKILSIALVAFVALAAMASFTACNKKDVINIGIIQIVDHPSLDEVRAALIEKLKTEGYVDGENIKIDYQSAQGEANNLPTIAKEFVSAGKDIVVAIATPSAQAMANETEDIPIVFSAVTDPVGAELVESLTAPGGNVTGTSDWISAEALMDVSKKICPDVKKIGALYSASEANSASTVADLEKYCNENDIEIVKNAITNTNEVQTAAQSLVSQVDAIFIPTDNNVASSMKVVAEVCADAKIPTFLGADSMVEDGGLVSLGVDYSLLGEKTAEMIIEIIDGKKPAEMPVVTLDQHKTVLNTTTAAELGITIPEDILLNSKIIE
jgi:ABC-type uncharacterized transport system, periplasmic component